MTVRGETTYPSLASSAEMIFWPHVGFSSHIRRIKARRSMSIGGRPRGWGERQRQTGRHAARCQLTTVSGFTSRTASSRLRERPAKAPRSRSNRWRSGRLTVRRRTMSCWQRTRFSATNAARGAAMAKMRSSRKRKADTQDGVSRTGRPISHADRIFAPHNPDGRRIRRPISILPRDRARHAAWRFDLPQRLGHLALDGRDRFIASQSGTARRL